MSINLQSLGKNLDIMGDDAAARTITVGQQITNSDILVIDTATIALTAAGALTLASSLTAVSGAISGAVTVGTTFAVTGATTLTGAVTMATGCTSPMQGTDNEVYGDSAGDALTSGSNNVFVGKSAGNATATHDNSVYVGKDAGLLATADNNVFVGPTAGDTTTTGSGCILIGDVQAASASTSDELRIHNDDTETPVISGIMGLNTVGVNTVTHNAQFTIVADDTDNLNVMELDQQDDGESFINFAGTSSAGSSTPISSFTTSGAVLGHLKIEFNGAVGWLTVTDTPS